ncbi:hypothetical protein PINS_up004231 [Pythium insidiosum]|nr:hypothetical protein PINS_up004231 [Pythium insidiosum]
MPPTTIMTRSPHERLRHALNEWLRSVGLQDEVSSLPLPIDTSLSPPSSCAVFSIDSSATLPELLYVLRALHRARIDLRVLRQALDLSSPDCPLGEWCSFCDEGDARVRLRVYFSGVKQFKRAINSAFDDEDDDEIVSTESPSLKRVRRAIKKLRPTSALESMATTPSRRSLPLVELCIEGFPSARRPSALRRLRDTLARYEAANDATTVPLVRIAYIQTRDLSHDANVAFAKSRIAMIADDTSTKWSCLRPVAAAEEEDEGDGGDVGGESSLLAMGNFVRLDASIVSLQRANASERCRQFHETLRCHAPTSLRELQVHYGSLPGKEDADSDAHRELDLDIADTFFSRRSRLRLDRLRLEGNITERDLRLMIHRLQKEEARHKDEKPPSLHSLECRMWTWERDVAKANDESLLVRGETLATLVTCQGGGVDTLRVSHTRVPVAELPSLASCCRHLDVKMSSVGWQRLQRQRHAKNGCSSDDDTGDAAAHACRLESLRLEVDADDDNDCTDNDGGATTLALCEMLLRFGPHLRSLSIAPHALRGRIAFNGALVASAIVLVCPQLQELEVDTVDEGFVKELIECLGRVYIGERATPCRLAQLSLRMRGGDDQDSSVTFRALLAALYVATHPLTRSLRSLRLELHLFTGREECERMARVLQALLERNTRLRDITLCVPHDGIGGSAAQEEEDGEGSRHRYVAVMAPLRHRLALLSALRARNLPRDVLETVMEMAARTRRRRLRVISKRPTTNVMNIATGEILATGPGFYWQSHGVTMTAG